MVARVPLAGIDFTFQSFYIIFLSFFTCLHAFRALYTIFSSIISTNKRLVCLCQFFMTLSCSVTCSFPCSLCKSSWRHHLDSFIFVFARYSTDQKNLRKLKTFPTPSGRKSRWASLTTTSVKSELSFIQFCVAIYSTVFPNIIMNTESYHVLPLNSQD